MTPRAQVPLPPPNGPVAKLVNAAVFKTASLVGLSVQLRPGPPPFFINENGELVYIEVSVFRWR